MLRTKLVRPAFIGRVAATASSTPLRQASKAPAWLSSSALRPEARSFPCLSVSLLQPRRLYSSEAEAAGAAKETSAPSDERVTRFSDLAKLGVDDSLVTAITQGMGYDTMTDVQTMTINPALAGKDL